MSRRRRKSTSRKFNPVVPYTKEEIEFIKNECANLTLADAAMLLGRSEWSVRCKMYALKHKKKEQDRQRETKRKRRQAERDALGGRQYDYWSEREMCIAVFSELTDAAIARIFKRTTESVAAQRRRIKKNPKKLARLKELWNAEKKEFIDELKRNDADAEQVQKQTPTE